ncbi:hypothetical protein FRB99_000747 [Tulasnella sp. 403]|nr:hypothetical protein FRB99_000747 [Tulasnella sp. 403]
MSLIVRAARPLAQRSAAGFRNARGMHVENTVYNMPFDYRNRKTFAVKLVLFCGTGFAIPFVAAAYQLQVFYF